MEKKDLVYYDVTNGPEIWRILDAFKYDLTRGGEIYLCFKLTERPDLSGLEVENLGTPNAIADESFSIKKVAFYKRVNENSANVAGEAIVHIVGDCDLFYLDDGGKTAFETKKEDAPFAAYHVEFTMEYNIATRKGMMACREYGDCYYDPEDY